MQLIVPISDILSMFHIKNLTNKIITQIIECIDSVQSDSNRFNNRHKNVIFFINITFLSTWFEFILNR